MPVPVPGDKDLLSLQSLEGIPVLAPAHPLDLVDATDKKCPSHHLEPVAPRLSLNLIADGPED